MTRARPLLFAAAVLAFTSATSHASEAENLRGLRSFFLSLEPPSDAAAKCGFTRDWMTARVKPVVSQAGLTFVSMSDADAFIEIVVTVLPNCSASLSVEVAAMARLEHSGRRAMVTVWRSSGIGGSEGAAVALNASAKALARDWQSTNK